MDWTLNGKIMTEPLVMHAKHYSPGAWAWILAALGTQYPSIDQPRPLSSQVLFGVLPELDLIVGEFLRRIRDPNVSVSRLFDEPHRLLSEPTRVRVRPTATLVRALALADQYALDTIQRLEVHCRHLFVALLKLGGPEISSGLRLPMSPDEIATRYVPVIHSSCPYDDLCAWNRIVFGNNDPPGTILERPFAKVFLSYKTCDASWVEQLARDLRRNGVDAWLDKWEILPGDSIPDKIQEGLRECGHLLFVMSFASVADSARWTKSEWQSVLMKEKEDGRVRVIPIMRQKVNPPELLRDKCHLDFSQDNVYERQLSVLVNVLLGRRRRPPVVPAKPWADSIRDEGV